MKGKVLFVAGLATGYVLGSRAGRERYEQIRGAWRSVWGSTPVQNQVVKVTDFAADRLRSVPAAVFTGIGSLLSQSTKGSSPGEKLDRTLADAQKTVDDAAERLEKTAKKSASATAAATKKPAAKKSTAKKPAAKKSTAKKPAAKKSTSSTADSSAKPEK